MMIKNQLLNKEDVCSMLGVSQETFWRLARSGEIPAIKLGRRWYVPRKQFEERIEKLLDGGFHA